MITLPKSTRIQPIEDKLWAMLWWEQNVTPSGLIIPEMAQEEMFFAKVIAVGPGKTIDVDAQGQPVHKPMFVVAGDNIVFARYSGERVSIGGLIYIVMSHDDILSKVSIPQSEMEKLFVPAGTKDVDPKRLPQPKKP
jgi:chaperonin GroES